MTGAKQRLRGLAVAAVVADEEKDEWKKILLRRRRRSGDDRGMACRGRPKFRDGHLAMSARFLGDHFESRDSGDRAWI